MGLVNLTTQVQLKSSIDEFQTRLFGIQFSWRAAIVQVFHIAAEDQCTN